MTATVEQQAEPTFQPPVRECVFGHPDTVLKIPHPDSGIKADGDSVPYRFVRDEQLAAIADGLMERMGSRYAALDKIQIVYVWANDLGKDKGDLRFMRIKKADEFMVWYANDGQVRGRFPAVFVLLNRVVARMAQLTNWQVQAAVHTALESITWREGKPHLLPPESGMVSNFILRRYGAWNESLQQTYKAVHAASTNQMSLFGDDEDDDEEGDE